MHLNLRDAIERKISLTTPKKYQLNENPATLFGCARAAGILDEKHALLDGKPASALSLRLWLVPVSKCGSSPQAGAGPYLYYLPKLENHLEAPVDEASSISRRTSSAFRVEPSKVTHAHRKPFYRLLRGWTARSSTNCASIPRSVERRSLGLHLQYHQKIQQTTGLPPPDRAQIATDRPVHAGVHRAVGEDLP
ncbi:MAG: hypothetical protein IPO22_18255 [Anaerolineales bacterium]|nr:hypothetical protein [Anaerolineales bacterium]